MLRKHNMMLALIGVLFLAGLAMLSLGKPATAEDRKHDLRTLLETVAQDNTQVNIEFVRPLITGENAWTLPDEETGRKIGEVGDDYICFTEPWNDITRLRCTPFENIVGLSFVK